MKVNPLRSSTHTLLLAALFAMSLPAARVNANHGPGTSGAGSSTQSGETLKQGNWDVSIRVDYTEFEHISREEAERRAEVTGEFDTVDRSFVTTVSISYGLIEDLQVGASLGFYSADNFIDAEEGESGIVDPAGLSDLWLNAKYRVMKGENGHLAIVGGVKLPTGRDDVKLDNGERLEASSQPGSGSVDFSAGVAYSRYLTPQVTLDISAVYVVRTKDDGFTVGDRLDTGLAIAYRLNPDVTKYPQFIVFGEILGVWLDKDDSDDHGRNGNSGGGWMYLSPGIRVRFSPNASFSIAPAFPVVQELNGDQVRTEFKLGFSFDVTF